LSNVYSPTDPRFAHLGPEKFRLRQTDAVLLDAKFETKPIGFFRDAAMRFAKSKISIVALIAISIIGFMAIVGPYMTPYGYNDQNLDYINLPPKIPALARFGIFQGTRVLQNRRVDALSDTSRYPEGSIIRIDNRRVMGGVELCDVTVDYYRYMGIDDDVYFLFGTDYLGRDLWTRVWRGTRVSLIIAIVSVICNVSIGLVYGSIAGYYGGSIDMTMMRITEIINAMPDVVVVTLFILYFGSGLISIILALAVKNWIGTARMIRGQFYRFKYHEYVLAARTLGANDARLMFRHILPNSIGPIITRAMIAIPGAIFTESCLAYIGLGIRAPESSIGVLLSEGQKVLLYYPEQTFFPAVIISILMIGFNLLSNGLRDAFDPTQRGTE
jgi:oligopeptide transport system permease protein